MIFKLWTVRTMNHRIIYTELIVVDIRGFNYISYLGSSYFFI